MDPLKSSWAFSSRTMSCGLSGSISGHRVFLVELGALPLAGIEHLFQMLDRLPCVFETNVERREPEAKYVGLHGVARAKVTDHATSNERLNDGIRTFGPSQADLRAAPVVLSRSRKTEAMDSAALLDE